MKTLRPYVCFNMRPTHGNNAGVTEVPRIKQQPESLTRGACHCLPLSFTSSSLNRQPTDVSGLFPCSEHVTTGAELPSLHHSSFEIIHPSVWQCKYCMPLKHLRR